MQVFEYYFSVAYIPLRFNRNRKWFVKKHIIAHFWYPWYRSFCNVVQIHIFIIDCNCAPHWILISPSLSEAKQLHILFKTKSSNPFNNKHFVEPLPHLLTTIFLFSPSHSHTPMLSIVIERRYTSSRDNWIASSAVPLLGKQRYNPNLSGERAKKAWEHAARPARRLPCRAQRREGLPVWNLQGEKNAKPI